MNLYVTVPSYALSGPLDRAERLSQAHSWAEYYGWNVIASPLLERYASEGSWLPAVERSDDMWRALGADIVWACRGGYAAIHLVPELLRAEGSGRTLLIGYSDTTVLHAVWKKVGLGPAIYGTFSKSLDQSRRATSMRAIFDAQPFSISHSNELAGRVLHEGTVTAPLFAACLVVLANLCGTPAMPDLRGCILALEDTSEWPYAVDSALNQLAMAGALDGIAGLLFGSFDHETPRTHNGPSILEVLTSWAERLRIPTIAALPFGHLDDALCLPVGTAVKMEAHNDGRWNVSWATQPMVAMQDG